MAFKHITIIGVGLLGGSIGLALKAALIPCRITGYGHRKQTLEKALSFGVIDQWTLSLPEAVKDADLVILCTPVGLFRDILEQIAGHLKQGAVVTDVGSTKRSVVADAQKILPSGCWFVGSHPMAGSEKRGVEYARADLFANALCIITPTANSSPAISKAIEQFWQSLGMRVVRLSPEGHDACVSDVSHMPHVLASILVLMQSREALPLAGKGFLDTTRIASGDAVMWRDILLDNSENLNESIRRFERELANFRRLLNPDKAEALERWLAEAASRRDELVKAKLKDMGE